MKNAVLFFSREFKTPSQAEFTRKVEQFLAGNSAIEIKCTDEDFIAFVEQFMKECRRDPGTIKKYGTVLNKIREFQKNRGRLSFTDVNMLFSDAFTAWLRKKGFSRNYIGAIIKDVKVFMKAAREKYKLHDNADYEKFRVEAETADTIYLTIHHAIPVTVNGQERVIYINADPRVAEAVTGDNMEEVSKALAMIKACSRFMAANYTSRNPRFVISNMCRDTAMAYTMTYIKEGMKYTNSLRKNWPVAANELRKYIAGQPSQLVAEFILNGGKTGYSNLMEIQDMARKLEKQARKGRDSNSAILLDYLQAANDFAENINRLAVYMTSRETGRSIERSISDAREITVNFGRHGTGARGAKYMNSLYLFSNVALQVVDNVTGAARAHPGRAVIALTAYASLGMLVPMLLWMTGGDDELEKYMEFPEWDLKNNFCIPTGRGVLKIPLPQDLRAFYGLGVGLVNCLAGKGEWEQELLSAASGLLDLAPYNLSNAAHSSWAELVPDIARPFAQLAANRTFSGRKIYNEWANENDPGFKQARVNRRGERYTEDWMVGFVEMLDRVTGGDGVKPGLASLNPDKLNHLYRGYLGGVYNMASQAFDSLTCPAGQGVFSPFRFSSITTRACG